MLRVLREFWERPESETWRSSVLDGRRDTRTLWILELLTEPKTYFVLSPSILENFQWLFLTVRIVISWQWLVFYAYFPVYFLDDSGCKCGCLASGYSEPLSEMIGHWSVLIPNDGHCLRSPSPGAWARQQTERANYQLHTRQTKTRTRDNFRRQHPAMPCSWSAKCVIWGYFSPCIVNLTIWDLRSLV